jgi:hypothetical protein
MSMPRIRPAVWAGSLQCHAARRNHTNTPLSLIQDFQALGPTACDAILFSLRSLSERLSGHLFTLRRLLPLPMRLIPALTLIKDRDRCTQNQAQEIARFDPHLRGHQSHRMEIC